MLFLCLGNCSTMACYLAIEWDYIKLHWHKGIISKLSSEDGLTLSVKLLNRATKSC